MRISDWSSDVCSSDLAHEPILFLFDLASYEKCHRRGNESEREDQRRGQGEHDRDRHRVEGFAFDAFESEDRQIDRGDDDDSENARFDHLRARRSDKSEALVAVEQSPEPVLRLAESAEAIFDDDDGSIDRKSTRLNSSQSCAPRIPSSA